MKKIDRLPMKLGKIADLVYFDGPFVSLFEDNERKTYYLYCWCNVNEKFNRWLVFKVSEKQIESHINGDISLRDMVVGAGSCFLCDINNAIEHENVYLTVPSELPKSYIPKINSFFDPELVGSEEDLFILGKFMSDNGKTIKRINNNIIPFPPIKKQITRNVFTNNQSFKKESRNAA